MGWIAFAFFVIAATFLGATIRLRNELASAQSQLFAQEKNAQTNYTNWQAEMVMSGKLSAENSELKKQLEAAQARVNLLAFAGAEASTGSHSSVGSVTATNGKVAKSGFTLKTSDVLNAGKLTPKKLREFREQYGISQPDLVRALRWDNLKSGKCLISNYENGHQGLIQWRIADIEKYMRKQGFNL